MKAWKKVAVCISLSLMCLFTCVGYAAVSGNLSIVGTVHAEQPDFDSMVIDSVSVCAGTTASHSTQKLLPTNLRTNITGKAGDKIVYKITARNDSESNTYVFAAAQYDASFSAVGGKLNISTSADEQSRDKLPATSGVNYYEGTPVAPGEEIVFYATYTLTSNISGEEILVNFDFKPIVYTITYMNGNEVYAIDCITDNTVAYTVRTSGPSNGNRPFAHWLNANATPVYSYAAGNTSSYMLSAKWDSIYQIMFVDNDGNVVYQESFTSSSKALSSEGQAIVNARLAEFAAEAAKNDLSVKWADYTISGAKSDITVRLVYTYTGNLKLTPQDPDGDGNIDYYFVEAVDALQNPTVVPGEVNGIPVTTIVKLYKNENNFDYGSGVQVIEIREGVKEIQHNALAYTSSLNTVSLPNSLEKMGKNIFSRNSGSDKKVLTVNYNGTMAEWKALVSNSDGDWHNGLETGSRIICSDGYFELTKSGILLWESYNWREYPN